MSPGGLNTLPSPPDTHSSYFGSIHTVPVHQRAMATPGSSLDFSLPPPMDTPTSRFRRGSSIGYHSAGLRDSRERNGSMGSKFLVIVVPPHSVAHEHGNLGHTLSTGPSHRLTQGLIMPLFPTMYGQLTAIAREFSFPSSAGICLYYCYSDHGVTMTPRLSDDVWATVWGFNDPSEKRSPIVGKIEFDIDMAQARWYAAWIASRHRESTENALYHGPTTAPSLPFRGDNRFTFPRTTSEDGSVDHMSTQQHSAPVITRHVPRKLSLVDRFDTHHVAHTETRPLRSSASPPTGLPLSSHILSPITQQEEPKSARLTLNERVKSWRQSAVVNSPIELESNAAEIVVAQSPEQSPGSQSSFHLEDYAFSISSVGPDDSTSIASYHQDYLPSVHLCDRVNGSVCLTASYCTSAGPLDFEFPFESFDEVRVPSPDIAWRMFEEVPPTPCTATSWGPPSPRSFALSIDDYTPSLDIAHRALFSRPSTPGTATSWGPRSFDGSYSPESPRSALSIHLCDRGEYSRPPTPQTATSWGPPSCDLSLPSPFRLPSPDVAHRTFEDADEWDMRASMLDAWRRALAEGVDEEGWLEEEDENVTEEPSVPEAAPSLPAQPWGHSWPYRQTNDSSKAVAIAVSEAESDSPNASTSGSAVEIQRQFASTATPWAHSWPYRKTGVSLKTVATAVSAFSTPASRGAQADPTVSSGDLSEQDIVKPWVHSWPYRKAGVSLKTVAMAVSAFSAPTSRFAQAEQPMSSGDVSKQDVVKPWAHSWPYRQPASLKTVAKAISGFSLNKAPKGKKKRSSPANSDCSGYPFFTLYPPVYPYFELYPPVAEVSSRVDIKPDPSVIKMSSNTGYPHFVLYPSVYPYFDLYPPVKFEAKEISVSKPMPSPISISPNAGYPSLVIYPPVYPHFALYPAVKDEVPIAAQTVPMLVASCAGYPSFILYPSGYPYNLTEIYPGVALSEDRVFQRSKQTSIPLVENPLSVFASYPFFCIYSPSYPNSVFQIYPPALTAQKQSEASSQLPQLCRVELNVYPSLIIYPSVYPHNLDIIYPPLKHAAPEQLHHTESAQRSRAAYPYFDLYPAIYPHFNLYPGLSLEALSALPNNADSKSLVAPTFYPSLVIYPSHYPHFDLYPPPAAALEPLKTGNGRLDDKLTISTKVVPGYPYFDLYPAVYPHFRIWPVNQPVLSPQPTPVVSIRRSLSAVAGRRLTPPPQPAPNLGLPPVPTALPAKRASPPPQPSPSFDLPPVPIIPTARRASPSQSAVEQGNRSSPRKTVRILDRPRRTRSSRLTHSELHAMVMMEQRGLALDTQLEGLDESDEISASLPAFLRRTEPSSTTSDAGPARFFPTPASSLARSSTLPLRRPRPADPVDPNVRGSVYSTESVRTRGLRFNTMSTINLEQKSPGLARRMSLWDKGNTVATTPVSPATTAAARTPTKNRDSIVGQRIRTFNSQAAS